MRHNTRLFKVKMALHEACAQEVPLDLFVIGQALGITGGEVLRAAERLTIREHGVRIERVNRGKCETARYVAISVAGLRTPEPKPGETRSIHADLNADELIQRKIEREESRARHVADCLAKERAPRPRPRQVFLDRTTSRRLQGYSA